MYTKFFGLNEKPFSITPDPRYLFMSERHTEGLAHLVYGVKDSSGFIQLTGEVGTGKTTLVRTLLVRIPKGVDVALILNPRLSSTEFLAAICEELKVPLPDDRSGTRELVDALNQRLLESHAAGRRTILMIDEAQNLSADVLEEVRLLTNLETAKQKLLQIILIAQPELRDTLSQTNLRQLAQRVTGRYHLEPLSREETSNYIDHRMKVAGGLGEIFDDKAKKEIYRFSGGVPRLINVICDRALLGAYAQETRVVTAPIIAKSIAEVSGKEKPLLASRWLRPALAALAGMLIVAGFWAAMRDPQPAAVQTSPVPAQQVPNEAPATPVAALTESATRASLDTELRAATEATTQEAAFATLMAIWGIDYDETGGPACNQAAAAGLSCLRQRGSWSVLKQLDRPVVLTLADSEGHTYQSVLATIDENTAGLQLGERRIEVAVDELSQLWYGQYTLLWQPPNGDPAILQRGIRDPKVLWLRQSLAALDPMAITEPGDSDVFDAELEQQLIDFQRRNQLNADGLAGQQTQIIINSQLGLDGRPRLSANLGEAG